MIVVTGAAGFIGSNLVREIKQSFNEDALLCDDLRSPEIPTVKDGVITEIRYNPHGASVDKDDLVEILEKLNNIECVVHLGACSDTMRYGESDRDYMMENNLAYSQRLFEVCANKQIKLVYASSAATYGDGSLGYSDDLDPDFLKPLNLYGESKNLFDSWALKQGNQPPKWYGLKFFNVFGINEQHKGRMASMVFQAYQTIKRFGVVNLFASDRPDIADGEQKRDFVPVTYAVDQMLMFMCQNRKSKLANGLYNIGTGVAHSYNELARAVFKAMKLEERIEYIPVPLAVRDRYQYFTQAENSKLKRVGVDPYVLWCRNGASFEIDVERYVHHLMRLDRGVGNPYWVK